MFELLISFAWDVDDVTVTLSLHTRFFCEVPSIIIVIEFARITIQYSISPIPSVTMLHCDYLVTGQCLNCWQQGDYTAIGSSVTVL